MICTYANADRITTPPQFSESRNDVLSGPYYALDVVAQMSIDESEVVTMYFFHQPVPKFSQLYYAKNGVALSTQ